MQPRAEVVLVCDQVIQDAFSGKKTLIGVFDNVIAHAFPAQHLGLFVFAKVTAAPGSKVIATWRIVGPAGLLQDLSMGELTLSPDGRGDLVGNFVGLVFAQPGTYRFIVLLNDDEAGEARIQVIQPVTQTGSTTMVH